MNIETILEKIGLQKNEILIYLDLLESGKSSISEIARRTKIHRPYVYKNIESLLKKNLISKSPLKKRILFLAESPEKLESALELTRLELQKIIPSLKNLYQTLNDRPTVRYLEGEEGLKFVLEDMISTLKSGETYYRYSSTKQEVFSKNSYLPTNYRKRRKDKDLYRFLITSEARAKERSEKDNLDIKTIPEKFDPFDDNIVHMIYGNKVAFSDFETETAVIIENKRFADFQKKIFLLLYRKL